MQLDGEIYRIQGVDVREICAEFGLPLYVYDAEAIRRQVEKFRSAFSAYDLRIKYAAKALSNINILRFMHRLGTGLDAVSIHEVHLGLRAGFEPGDILFTPNCVGFDEIVAAVELGVAVNLENLPNLREFGRKYGSSVPCCIRLNPHVAVEEDAEKVAEWHRRSKFGIAISQLDELEQVVRDYDIRVNGIHIHSSSVILDADVFIKGAEIVLDVARRFPNVEFIDLGGGINVPFRPGEVTIDIAALARDLKPSFDRFCAEYGRQVQLWLEPGRFLVSDCGTLLVRTNVVKFNGYVDIVGVDSGFNHLLRPKLYDAYHHIINVSNPNGSPRTYTVVGYICESDDFARDREIAEVRAGDVLAIQNAGAYGMSMASNYNMRFRPAEVFVIDGAAKLIRHRETMADLLSTQIDLET
jgi:diaminopimelate decarboxylase